ncbi:MAG: sulfite exporter TauE/SafE family protein [Magnetococcales bacterium]|nr:sulfite exporter TauE/SafE family protein [Magnetococcales bacterium]
METLYDPVTLLMIFTTFVIAGCVKGVVGIGLPSVSVTLLTISIGLPEAMGLLLMPTFVANIFQAVVGGSTGQLLKRIWSFLLMAVLFVWLGSLIFINVNLDLVSSLLGATLIAHSLISLANFQITVPKSREKIMGILLGAANGTLGGMTGSFVIPGVLYLNAIGLPRDLMIQAVGMLFALSTAALAVAMGHNNILSFDLWLLSSVSVIPAIIGMILGKYIRSMLSEKIFKKVFFISLFSLGFYILTRSI